MPLPLIAAAAGRLGARAAKGAHKGAGKVLKKGGEGEKPSVLSPEGITMLALAGILEVANVILGFLDVIGIGIGLGPIFNSVGVAMIGGWLWMRFGKLPLKKSLFPFILNSIPLAKFIPWWLVSVATSLDWKGDSTKEQPQQESQQVPV